MPQQELDLFQFAAGSVTESGARPPQIVRRELRDCQFLCVHSNDVLRLHRNRYDGLDLLAFTRRRHRNKHPKRRRSVDVPKHVDVSVSRTYEIETESPFTLRFRGLNEGAGVCGTCQMVKDLWIKFFPTFRERTRMPFQRVVIPAMTNIVPVRIRRSLLVSVRRR